MKLLIHNLIVYFKSLRKKYIWNIYFSDSQNQLDISNKILINKWIILFQINHHL